MKVSKKFNTNVIGGLLCGQFPKPSDRINIINVDNIVRNKTNTQQPSITKVDQLPTPIIGEIASYLNPNDYSSSFQPLTDPYLSQQIL